ncbi:hypothetical protein [Streptomyces sp. CS62]|uniref:hypothetical protein n=1 Tax=Streptomyces sp. CS62 TaxID=3119268 RepID=UPI002F932E99
MELQPGAASCGQPDRQVRTVGRRRRHCAVGKEPGPFQVGEAVVTFVAVQVGDREVGHAAGVSGMLAWGGVDDGVLECDRAVEVGFVAACLMAALVEDAYAGHRGHVLVRIPGGRRHRPFQEVDGPFEVGCGRGGLVAGPVGDAEVGEDHHLFGGVGGGLVKGLFVAVDRVVQVRGQPVAGEAPAVGAAEFGEASGAVGGGGGGRGQLQVREGVVDLAGIAVARVAGEVATADVGQPLVRQRPPRAGILGAQVGPTPGPRARCADLPRGARAGFAAGRPRRDGAAAVGAVRQSQFMQMGGSLRMPPVGRVRDVDGSLLGLAELAQRHPEGEPAARVLGVEVHAQRERIQGARGVAAVQPAGAQHELADHRGRGRLRGGGEQAHGLLVPSAQEEGLALFEQLFCARWFGSHRSPRARCARAWTRLMQTPHDSQPFRSGRGGFNGGVCRTPDARYASAASTPSQPASSPR